MELQAVKQELLTLERRYWSAVKERDSGVASSLSDDPCLVVGAQGISEIDRDSLERMLQSATYELNDFSLEDVKVRKLSDGVVALAYRVSEDLTVEGKDVSLKAYDLSVWAKRGSEWVCVVHTESLAGDPFGRH